MERRCNNCRFFMTTDEGYSDYTVTNTEVHCLYDANPFFPCEESYSWNREDSPDYEQLKVAEQCSLYVEGEGLHRNVEFYDDDFLIGEPDDLIALYKLYWGR